MTYWLSKTTYTKEYVVWRTKPAPHYSTDMQDVMYCDGEVQARGLYSFGELFPVLAMNQAGCIEIEITDWEDENYVGYLIRRKRGKDEGFGPKEAKQTS